MHVNIIPKKTRNISKLSQKQIFTFVRTIFNFLAVAVNSIFCFFFLGGGYNRNGILKKKKVCLVQCI